MITCSLCHFEAELDDVALTLAAGRSICLRCFDRETGNSQPMPTALRRQLQAALAAAA
jgi:recombinational DNA repair protein (RecF pathway)